MAGKKNNYISADLDFAEEMLEKWKKYTLDNPYDEVEDRKEMQMTKTGGSFYTVVQTREQIQTGLRNTLKEYLAMVEVVKRLREEKEAEQAAAKGNANIPSRMNKKDKNGN